MTRCFTFGATVWLYEGSNAWHFVSVPTDVTEEIEFYFAHAKKGWGSLPVKVTVNQVTWQTSIFTDKKRQSFLLPLKAEIRKKAALEVAATATFTLEISDTQPK